MAIPYREGELFSENYDVERLKLYLENGGNVHARNNDNCDDTPLIFACECGNEEAVRLLLAYNADVNAQESSGITALYMICAYNHPPSIANLLIENGADIEIKDNLGNTPLFEACLYKNVAMIELLVNAGANIYETNDCGDTLLHYVWNEDISEYFLEKGLDPNAQNKHGNTSLHQLFRRRDGENPQTQMIYIRCANLFMHYGFNLYIENDEGKTILDYIETPCIKEELVGVYSNIECSKIKEPSL